MNDKFDFNNINQFNVYSIELNEYQYKKMQNCIKTLKAKYDEKILELYEIEKMNSKEFDLHHQKEFILSHRQLLVNIINDVLLLYKDELENLDVAFLSGSFARGTNKMSSDIDLHFFYKTDNYNYVTEEIISYIISRIVNKSRDCIDPTFIFNIQTENKTMITNKMDKTKLNIILNYKNKQVKYSYKHGKKRRFYIQYYNTRNIKVLFNYLMNQMSDSNEEWCHCFDVIYGKDKFNHLYHKLFLEEIRKIDKKYIKDKILKLKEELLLFENNTKKEDISDYKKIYQSSEFKLIYEYASIIRLILMLENNNNVEYLNLLFMYDLICKTKMLNNQIFIKIYKYMWNLETLTIYCHDNNINYGLHNHEKIDYSTNELDYELNNLNKHMILDLERLGGIYE